MNVIVEQQPDIVVSRAGSLGRIVLDRPKALNALTLGMVRAMDAALDAFAADAGIAAVLLSGAGERGLCAGGDIRAIYDSGKAGSPLAEAFWRECAVDAAVLAEWVINLGRRDALCRAAHLLCELATRYASIQRPIGGEMPFLPTQNHLADMLGLHRGQISKHLTEFRRLGYLAKTPGRITIISRAGLAREGG